MVSVFFARRRGGLHGRSVRMCLFPAALEAGHDSCPGLENLDVWVAETWSSEVACDRNLDLPYHLVVHVRDPARPARLSRVAECCQCFGLVVSPALVVDELPRPPSLHQSLRKVSLCVLTRRSGSGLAFSCINSNFFASSSSFGTP